MIRVGLEWLLIINRKNRDIFRMQIVVVWVMHTLWCGKWCTLSDCWYFLLLATDVFVMCGSPYMIFSTNLIAMITLPRVTRFSFLCVPTNCSKNRMQQSRIWSLPSHVTAMSSANDTTEILTSWNSYAKISGILVTFDIVSVLIPVQASVSAWILIFQATGHWCPYPLAEETFDRMRPI